MELLDIVVSASDGERLAAMLEEHRRPHASELDPASTLAALLAQARWVPDAELPEDRVAMGSTVTYVEQASRAARTVTLAYPQDADLGLRRISVLSPIGRGLIGRSRGALVEVALPGERFLEIHITAVERAAPLEKAA